MNFFKKLFQKILSREVEVEEETRSLYVYLILYGPIQAEDEDRWTVGVKLRDGDTYKCTEFFFSNFDYAYDFCNQVLYSRDCLEVRISKDADIEEVSEEWLQKLQ